MQIEKNSLNGPEINALKGSNDIPIIKAENIAFKKNLRGNSSRILFASIIIKKMVLDNEITVAPAIAPQAPYRGISNKFIIILNIPNTCPHNKIRYPPIPGRIEPAIPPKSIFTANKHRNI